MYQFILIWFTVFISKRANAPLDEIHLLEKKSTIARAKPDKDEEKDDDGSSSSGDKDIETEKDAMGESIDAPKGVSPGADDAEQKKKDAKCKSIQLNTHFATNFCNLDRHLVVAQ